MQRFFFLQAATQTPADATAEWLWTWGPIVVFLAVLVGVVGYFSLTVKAYDQRGGRYRRAWRWNAYWFSTRSEHGIGEWRVNPQRRVNQ